MESVVSINVTPVNDAPVTADQSKTTAEDTAISDKIVATDVDQDSLTFTLKSGNEPKHGTLTLDSATGEYTYTPAKDYNGNDSFTVVVSDGHGSSVESVVSINVTPVNDAPVTEDQSKTTAEDTAVNGQIAGTDADQDSLTFTLKSGSEPKHGTLTLDSATGEYTYTPAKDYNGNDSFTVVVSDGQGGSVESVVSINVTPVNDAPVTEDQTKTTAEDTAISDKIVATDVDQDSLTFTLKSGNEPKHGTLTLDPATGEYTYTPAKDYNGNDSFTVVVSDGHGSSVESVVSINVTPVNDAPVTEDQSKTTAEDTAVSDKIVATDVDQDSLTFTLKSGSEPKHGTLTLDSATGEYTYTPAKDYNGADSFTVVVSDGQGGSVESVVSITVTPVNDDPVTADQSKTTAEDTAVSDKIVATDVDQDSLTFTLKSGSEPKHGTLVLDPATGEYTYTPAKDYNGNDSFTVVVSDGHGGSVESVVSINVTPVNDAPVTEDQSKTTTEDTAVNGQIVGTDVDQDNLTFTLKSGNEPKHGTLTLDSVTGEYTYTPAKDYNGNDSFTVVVSDGHGGSVESVVSINVTPVNDAPETNPATASGNEDSPITVNLSGSDIDGTVDHFVIKSLPANGTLMLNGVALNIGDNVPATGNAASLTFTPNANWNGDTSFQFAAVDNQNLADATPATATIHVEPVNDAPETNPATASGNEDSPITVNLSGSDIDGTVDHFVIQSLPANGTLMLNGVVLNVGDNVPATGNTASLSFIPNANWNGDTSFQFAAVDNQNLADSTPATATIHVEPVNDAPNGADNSITLNEDSSRSFSAADFGFTDVDQGDSLSAVRIDGLPSAGSLSLNGVAVTAGQVIAASQLGGLVFTPAANASGNHYADFTFSVKDSAGAFDSTPNTITLNVTPVNDAPLSADATANIHIGQTYTFGLNDFAFNDSADAANGQLQSLQSVIIKSLPDSGTLWLNGAKVVAGQPVSPSDIASGKLTFVPDAAGSNAHFDFAVQDSGGTANGGADTSATHGFDILVGQMQIPTIDPNGDNNLIGGAGDDVILGDVGGTLTVTQPGTNYNIALIVDTSGSMGDSLAGASTTNYADTRMKLVKDALIKLADQLKGHDGVINIALIGFNSTASLKVSVSDLTDANVNKLVDAIGTSQTQGLQAGGGTDYQEAFGQAVTWFNGQKNGFENVSLFLTDGDPTESTGSGTLMQNTTKAFADLSALSEVRAIGIGTNVNEATLKYFDNTSVTGTGSVTYYKGTTLFDFEGSTALPSGWTGNTDGNGSVSISSGKLQMMDTHVKSGSSTVISSNLTVAQGKTSTFSFDLVKNMMKGDQFTWTLEKQKADGSWGQVDQNTLDSNDNGGTLTTIAVGAGTYRLEFELNDNSDKGKDNNATVTIDNISRNDQVAAPVGQVDIVTQADQLNAALHGGSSSSDLAPSGNDTVHAGSGNDIVFGDSINTDNLPWGVNGNPVKPAELPAGSGVSALSAFLELKNGHVATSEEMYSFIKENHALFNVDGDTRGGSDNLYGGEGNDILYGQGGNDFLFGEGGNDILFGGTGDDQLTGGKGNDILTGGAGADTFIWKAGDTGNDTITDFKAGEGDRIDISDLLPDAAQNDILSYLKVDTTTSTLQVSTTGQVNSGADVTIKLSGVDLTTYGSNPTDIVKQLVAGSDPVVKTEHH
ncbi:Ig-like domain-containing protein [Pseudomonas sp. LA21]|uniref:tandem-95 repeat protein n=1 Tax=Pseudomonas sp. LA21 TaxID=2893373 RepID=UPI003263BA8A